MLAMELYRLQVVYEIENWTKPRGLKACADGDPQTNPQYPPTNFV